MYISQGLHTLRLDLLRHFLAIDVIPLEIPTLPHILIDVRETLKAYQKTAYSNNDKRALENKIKQSKEYGGG